MGIWIQADGGLHTMKQVKQHIFFLLSATILFVSILFFVVFNITMNHYVDKEARSALTEQNAIEAFPMNSSAAVIDQSAQGVFVSEGSVQSLFTAQIFYQTVDPIYGTMIMSEDEKNILDYMKSHSLEEGSVQVVEIGGNTYYLQKMQSIMNPLIYDSDLSIGTTVIQPTALYINVTPVKKIIKRVNMLFAGILIVAGAISVVMGIKAGSVIEGSERKLKHFFQNASHELKTPLMSIQGYAEGIHTGVIQDIPMASEVILRHSDEMYGLIQELLSLSKLDSGEYRLKKDTVEMEKLLYECLSSVEPLAEQYHIQFDLEWSDCSMYVKGDATYLKKAINAVLENAIRYANQEIRIRLFTKGRNIVLSILDDGNGIEEADLPHIFERFYTGKNGNTGIGLAMAYDVVKHHKGKIDVSNTQTGTEFVMEFPETK